MGTPLPAAIEDQFVAVFGADSRAAIEDATVYIEPLPDNNRKFATRYYGKDVNLVVKRALQAVEGIDSYASPMRGNVYKHGEYFACDVTYYSVD